MIHINIKLTERKVYISRGNETFIADLGMDTWKECVSLPDSFLVHIYKIRNQWTTIVYPSIGGVIEFSRDVPHSASVEE